MLSILPRFLIFGGSFRLDHTSQILIFPSAGVWYISFVPVPSSTLYPMALLTLSRKVDTVVKFGNEWTESAFSRQGFGFLKLIGTGSPMRAPCVVRTSLHWGEKWMPVITDLASNFEGRALECLFSLTFQMRRMPLASPVASTLGCHGHHATDCREIGYQLNAGDVMSWDK